MKKIPTVSFIIPTLNSARFLTTCITSIGWQASNYPSENIEIIVVDGGSTDNTLVYARLLHAKILHNTERIAESGKRVGLSRASGEYVVFMDSDNEISDSHWLEKAIQALEANPGVIGLESYYPKSGGVNNFCSYLTSLLHVSDPVSWMISVNPVLLCDENSVEMWRFPNNSYAYPLGANGFIFRREDLVEAGALMCFEDTQIALRIAKKKQPAWLRIKGMGVHHYYVQSFWEFLKKRRRQTFHFLSTKSNSKLSWTAQNPAMPPILSCLCCATLVIPIIQMLWGFWKDRNWKWVYHPIACLLSVVGIGWGLVSFKLSNQSKLYESTLQPKTI